MPSPRSIEQGGALSLVHQVAYCPKAAAPRADAAGIRTQLVAFDEEREPLLRHLYAGGPYPSGHVDFTDVGPSVYAAGGATAAPGQEEVPDELAPRPRVVTGDGIIATGGRTLP